MHLFRCGVVPRGQTQIPATHTDPPRHTAPRRTHPPPILTSNESSIGNWNKGQPTENRPWKNKNASKLWSARWRQGWRGQVRTIVNIAMRWEMLQAQILLTMPVLLELLLLLHGRRTLTSLKELGQSTTRGLLKFSLRWTVSIDSYHAPGIESNLSIQVFRN